MKPATRVKAIAKQLVDPVLLEQMTPGAQQTAQELRARLLEIVKLTPADRVRGVVTALNDATFRIQMITPASERVGALCSELLDVAALLEAADE